MAKTGNITDHFQWSEAEDRYGNVMPPDVEQNVVTMAGFLEDVRKKAGCQLPISSWFRSPEHPLELAKDQPGPHTTGLAVDVLCHGRGAMSILKAALDTDVRGIGISQKGSRKDRFIHLDIVAAGDGKPRPHIWSY